MNIFSRIRIPKLGKNNFDLSFENKLTCQMGQLVPIVCQEVVPGDEFKISSNILVRFNPLVAPMMHRVDVYTHFFFVPNRLIWNEWEDFITGGEDGLAQPQKPYTTWREVLKTRVPYQQYGPGSLFDYLGYNFGLSYGDVQTLSNGNFDQAYDWLDEPMDILPLRAYSLIYSEYYRNQNTQSEPKPYLGSGLIGNNQLDYTKNINALMTLRYRNWGLDYFTSALPFSQRGPEQQVPLQGVGSVGFQWNRGDNLVYEEGYQPSDLSQNTLLGANEVYTEDLNEEYPGHSSQSLYKGGLNDNPGVGLSPDYTLDGKASVDNSKNLYTNLDNAGISIRDLRRTERIQEWLERSARSGSRYIEQIKGHFGIFSSDSRLQRPEYLGGGKQAVQISAVDQTSATDVENGSTPLGTMAGKAISGGVTNGFKTKVAEEHGFIIGIMSVLPKGGYHQGLHRKFSRFDKLDYFWPEFQNIGDQEIKTKELYFAQSLDDNDSQVGFGYTPRYSEYKCNHDEVHGDFKTTLDFWHLNRKFANVPKLNGAFSSTNGTIRQDIFAVQSLPDGGPLPNMMIDIYNSIKARRPMYYYEDPQL